jgi:hypothetical protein
MPRVPDLSLCLIVRDEAARLPACLASVRPLRAEIVVVDTGSADDTPDIARAAGARVAELPWPGDFAAARNASLALATGRWVLVLDADETLPAASVEAVRKIVAGPADHACSLVQRSSLAAGAGHVVVRIVRLFPRHPGVRFERPVHEQVNTSLERSGIRIVDTEVVLDHSGYADARVMPGKLARNRALIEAALAREPDGDPNLRFFHAATLFDAGDLGAAAEQYLACALAARERRRRLSTAARVKQAECLARLGRGAEAMEALDACPDTAAHPLACELRAAEAEASGRREEARRLREQLLDFADTAYLPPVALLPMKVRAVEALAEAWFAANRKDLAVGLLRLGLELAAGRRPCGSGLGDAYRRISSPSLHGLRPCESA